MARTIPSSDGTGAAGPRPERGGHLVWQIARLTAVRQETPTVKTFTLALPAWQRHRAGQHYDLKLTAPDGYQAQRSYSVASEPERTGEIDLTVERLDEGEVSSYLHDVLVPGDRVEVRGPLGGYFVWEAARTEPLLLVAGGSGVVPLMSMLRHRKVTASQVPTLLLYSARSHDEIIYREELEALTAADPTLRVDVTLTRSRPAAWGGYDRRIDHAMLGEVLARLPPQPRAYVCGPTSLVESVAGLLTRLGLGPSQVLTERFGPTGSP
jgi:ferredoxin-NADP reductase